MRRFFLSSIVVIICLSASVLTASAQGVITPIHGMTLKSSADNPSPGQNITITAESYITSLDAANMVWSLNGNVYQKGVGLTSIKVQAPDQGKSLDIEVSATTPDGQNLSSKLSLKSGAIDAIIETDGYVPPFFAGKVPLAYEGGYRIIAFPHIADKNGKEYDPANLVYKWSKDFKAVPDASGYGKQVFSWKDEIIPRPRTISISVSSRDGSAQAQKTLVLQATNPFLQFYENDPLYGTLYNNASGDKVGLGSGGETSVLVVPYGFDTGDKNLTFRWSINSATQSDLSGKRSIVLRAPAGQSGSSLVNLMVNSAKNILESATAQFTAVFSSNSATNDRSNFNGF